MERRIGAMHGHMILCGWGRVGQAIARRAGRADLVVVDASAEQDRHGQRAVRARGCHQRGGAAGRGHRPGPGAGHRAQHRRRQRPPQQRPAVVKPQITTHSPKTTRNPPEPLDVSLITLVISSPEFGVFAVAAAGVLCFFLRGGRVICTVSPPQARHEFLVAAVFRTKRLLRERCSATCQRRRPPGQARHRRGGFR